MRPFGVPAHEPRPRSSGEGEYVVAYLRYHRSVAVERCRSLTAQQLRTAYVPSGWTPLEMLSHLAHMEQRWFVWGFLAESVARPFGDWSADPTRTEHHAPEGRQAHAAQPDTTGDEPRWHVPAHVTLDDVVAFLTTTAARTDEVLTTTPLDRLSAVGGRFASDPPDLRWICFHVLQEYAWHIGHLEIAAELALAGGQPYEPGASGSDQA